MRFTPTGIANIHSVSLVEPKDVFMPPLHITLGFMENFIKELKKEQFPLIAFLCNKFAKIFIEKMKDVFVGHIVDRF